MRLTKDWLHDHLNTKKSEQQIIEKLNEVGLEVENVETPKNEVWDFIVSMGVESDKHRNAV